MVETEYPMELDGSKILGHTTQAGRDYKVKRYDFKRPDKLSKEQVRTIFTIHDTIGRHMEPILSSILGQSISVTLESVDQLVFHELIEAASDDESFAILNMQPLRVPGLIQIGGQLGRTIVHRSCGGLGVPTEKNRSELTEIESLIVMDTVETVVPAIKEGWSKLIELDCHVTAIECDHRNAMIVPRTDMIITTAFKIIAESHSWYLTFILPYLTIEAVASKLSKRQWYNSTRRPSASPSLGSLAADLKVHSEISLDLGHIPLRELAKYAAGETLLIPFDASPLLCAGGVDVARFGRPASFVELPLELPIEEWASDEPSMAILGASRNGQTESVQKVVEAAATELKTDIRGIRDVLNQLVDDRRTIDAEAVAADDGTRFTAAQVRDVSIALSAETAQTVAFVLSSLDETFSAGVLAALPESQQADVVRCLAVLSPASRSLHRRIVSFISRNTALALRLTVTGGYETAVKILNHVPRSVETRVMDQFKNEDPPLFEGIARRMFVFEDFVLVDATTIQKLAERVAPVEFAVALKRTPDQVREHILSAFESEYSESVLAATADLGRVRLKDVEAAQHDIVEELRQLEEAGEVVIARPDDLVE